MRSVYGPGLTGGYDKAPVCDPDPMARMLARMRPSFCPVCRRSPAGPDCPDTAVDKKTQRAREKQQWRRLERQDSSGGWPT